MPPLSGIAHLCQELGFGDDTNHFFVWVASDRVKPAWDEFYRDFYSKATKKSRNRTVNAETLIRLCVDQLAQNRDDYSDSLVNKDGWERHEYYARFVLRLIAKNRTRNRLWVHKSSNEFGWMCDVAHQVLQVIRWDFNPSRPGRLQRILAPRRIPAPNPEETDDDDVPRADEFFLLQEAVRHTDDGFRTRDLGDFFILDPPRRDQGELLYAGAPSDPPTPLAKSRGTTLTMRPFPSILPNNFSSSVRESKP